MASDEHLRRRILPIAICCAVASVLVSVFLGARFLRKKRCRQDNSRGENVDPVPQQQQQNEELGGSHDIPSTSSPIDAEPGHEYEVFLSFRGSENRKKFTDNLYISLTGAGVRAFRDNEELPVGEEIGPKLMKGIRQSKIGIPIFSKDYASSKWCLKEVTEMVKCMKETKQLIMPVFLDVTPDEVQHLTGSYADSFARHEKRFGLEVVRGWRNALEEVVKLKGLELNTVANGHEGEFIKFIVARVIRQLKKSYLDVGSVLVGIEDRAEELMKKLEVGINDVRIIGLWGMGGIGKTTLAKYVYNQIVDKFDSNSFLNNIRETSRNPRGLQYLQSKLASDILRREREEYANVEEGINVLKERLRDRKALILLDDVDHADQLKALMGDPRWFHQGSRIIVTTREKEVLHRFQEQDVYEVALIDEGQAFELLCKHAFGEKLPRADLVEYVRDIVNITGRLPLALEVIGSFLSAYGGRKDIWRSTVEKLKRKPNMNVQDKLKISYESLDREQKEIFLDIACFFIGTDVRVVTPMWNDCEFFPEVGIEILLMKSLIKIGEDNTIWMHDQLRDLGRDLVHQESYREPGQQSRLWNDKDAFDVLEEQQGTLKVEAISLKGHHSVAQEDCLKNEMFKNMSRLRILELDVMSLDGNFQHLFHQLRWLSWHRENISPPENLTPKSLIVLDLSRSLIQDENWIRWSSIKIGIKLKVLNLSNCRISRTPDFSAFPSLESLILESCEDLVLVDPSIGLLNNLILLNLRKCWRLKKLPEQLGSMESIVEFIVDDTQVEELPISRRMKKLEILSANSCRYLREIPSSVGFLVKLRKLSLVSSGVNELPDSIGQLTSLVELTLSYSGIKRLPDFVGDLHDLELLKINSTDITCLPGNLGSLKKLKVLDASWYSFEGEREIPDEVLSLSSLRDLKFCGVKSLPPSMSPLTSLQTLNLGNCRKLRTLPELPSRLISLTVEASSTLTSLNLANLVNLKELSLSEDFELKEECLSSLRKLERLRLKAIKISTLPKEIGAFLRLKEVDISGCRELECLPALPSNLSLLRIDQCDSLERLPDTLPSSLSLLRFDQCGSLERLPDLSNLKNLSELEVRYCSKIKEIEGLSNLTSLKVLRTYGSPLTKLDGLERLEFLIELSADSLEIERLPDLSSLKNLERLYLSSSRKLVEIQGLGSLQNLKKLGIVGCTSIKCLPELPNCLEQLSLLQCEQFSEIDAVAELESLEYLDIRGCRGLRKLPNLSKLQRLEYIGMRECENIAEIPGLEELSGLRRLSIFGCKALKLPDLSKQESNGLRINHTMKQW